MSIFEVQSPPAAADVSKLLAEVNEVDAQVEAYKAHLTASYALGAERIAQEKLKSAHKKQFGFENDSDLHAPFAPTINAIITQSVPLAPAWIIFPMVPTLSSEPTPSDLFFTAPPPGEAVPDKPIPQYSRFDLDAPPPVTADLFASHSTNPALSGVQPDELRTAGPLVDKFGIELASFARVRGLDAHALVLPKRIITPDGPHDEYTNEVAIRNVVAAAARAGCYLMLAGVEVATEAALHAVGQSVTALSVLTTRATFRLVVAYRGTVDALAAAAMPELLMDASAVGSAATGRVTGWASLKDELQAARFLAVYDADDAADERARCMWAAAFDRGHDAAAVASTAQGARPDPQDSADALRDAPLRHQRFGRLTTILGAVSDRSDATRAIYLAPLWARPQVFRKGQARPLGWAMGHASAVAGWPRCPGIPRRADPDTSADRDADGALSVHDAPYLPDPARPSRLATRNLACRPGDISRARGADDHDDPWGPPAEWVPDAARNPLAALEAALDAYAERHAPPPPYVRPDVAAAEAELARSPILTARARRGSSAGEPGSRTDAAVIGGGTVPLAPQATTRSEPANRDAPQTLMRWAPLDTVLGVTRTEVRARAVGATPEAADGADVDGVPLVLQTRVEGYELCEAGTSRPVVPVDSAADDGDLTGVDSQVFVGCVGGSSSDDENDAVALVAAACGLHNGLYAVGDGPPPRDGAGGNGGGGAAIAAPDLRARLSQRNADAPDDLRSVPAEALLHSLALSTRRGDPPLSATARRGALLDVFESVAARRDILRRRRRAFRSYVRDGEYWRTAPMLTGQLAAVGVNEILRQMSSCANLQSLSVVGQRLSPDDRTWLVHALSTNNVPLRSLSLVGTQLGDTDCAAVVRALICARRTLETLDLSNNGAATATLFALAMPPNDDPISVQMAVLHDAASVPDARHYDLALEGFAADALNGGDARARRALRENAVRRVLWSEREPTRLLARQLRLDGCFLTAPTRAAVRAFGAAMAAAPFDDRGGLVALSLADALWPARHALLFLREAVPRLRSLRRLAIPNISVKCDLPLLALAPALAPRHCGRTLVRLNLRACGLTAVSAVVLASALRASRCLQSIDLSDNPDLFVTASGAADAVAAAADTTVQRFADLYQRAVGAAASDGVPVAGAAAGSGRRPSELSSWSGASRPSSAAAAPLLSGDGSSRGEAGRAPSVLAAALAAARGDGALGDDDIPYVDAVERTVGAMHATVAFRTHVAAVAVDDGVAAPRLADAQRPSGSARLSAATGTPRGMTSQTTLAPTAAPRPLSAASGTPASHAARCASVTSLASGDTFDAATVGARVPRAQMESLRESVRNYDDVGGLPSGAAHAIGPAHGVAPMYQPSAHWADSVDPTSPPTGLEAFAAATAAAGLTVRPPPPRRRTAGEGFVVSRVAVAKALMAAIAERRTVRALRLCNTGLDDASALCVLVGAHGVQMLDLSDNALSGTPSGEADGDMDWAARASATHAALTSTLVDSAQVLGAVSEGARVTAVDAMAAVRRRVAMSSAALVESVAAIAGGALADGGAVAEQLRAPLGDAPAYVGGSLGPRLTKTDDDGRVVGGAVVDPFVTAMGAAAWVPAGALFGRALRDRASTIVDLRVRNTTPAFARDVAYVLRWSNLRVCDLRGNLSPAAALPGVDVDAAAVGVPSHLVTDLDVANDVACLHRILDAVEQQPELLVLW